MEKNKNGWNFGPKSQARSKQNGPKMKNTKIKFQNSQKYQKKLLSSLQVQCRLQFAIWTSRLWIRARQSYPRYMKFKKM